MPPVPCLRVRVCVMDQAGEFLRVKGVVIEQVRDPSAQAQVARGHVLRRRCTLGPEQPRQRGGSEASETKREQLVGLREQRASRGGELYSIIDRSNPP